MTDTFKRTPRKGLSNIDFKIEAFMLAAAPNPIPASL